MDPEYVPFLNPVKIGVSDLLHLFPDGVTRHEGGWMTILMVKLGIPLADINRAIRQFGGWPADVRIPEIKAEHLGLPKNGKRPGKAFRPDGGNRLRMTGSQCMHFATYSVDVLDPLLTPSIRAQPFWKCWVVHCQLFALCLQHEVTIAEIHRVDDLQLEHSRLFDLVPEYNGLKRPKHHFFCHLAPDMYHYGPLRGLWTFGFEGFNAIIKEGAEKSNYKNETVSIMRHWSMRHARWLVESGRDALCC